MIGKQQTDAETLARFVRITAARLRWLEFHYTPKHGSWLNMVEIGISVLSNQCLDGRIPDEDTLRREITAWEAPRHEQRATVDWHFANSDTRVKLKRLYPNVS